MSEQERWYTDEIRELLYKERYSTTSHHYFFELKEAKNGSKYIIIDQRKKVGNDFVSAKIRLFADEMSEFQRILNKLICLAFSEEEQVISPEREKNNVIVRRSQHGFVGKAKAQWQRLWGGASSQRIEPFLHPGFFNTLLNTENWQEFEKYTSYLLKLLGIQLVYSFFGERQAGKADGFLKTGTVAILYDCTLRSGQIDVEKFDQINNYCAQLQHGSIELSPQIKEEFFHHQKQVWIITKGMTRIVKIINTIEVKEIGIADIISVYQERLTGNMNQHMLEMRLQHL